MPLRSAQLAELDRAGLLQSFRDQLSPAASAELHRELHRESGVVANLSWYRPRGGASKLFTLTDPEVLIVGPAGTGKSLGCLERLFHLAVEYPGARFLIVRKTAKSLTSSALVTWKTKVVADALLSGYVEFYGGSQEEPAQYRFANGSKVMLVGMDNPDKVMSTEFDLIFVQEAIELTEDDWEKLTTRLRNGVLPFQQILADTNPSAPSHWLRARAQRGVLTMVESRHEDNPTLFSPDGEMTPEGEIYLSRLDALTGVRYQRLRRGLWVAAEGIIYEEYDPAIHIIDRFDIPDDWMRFWAVDFGWTNPFVCQFWAQDPDGRLYLYREWVHTKKLVEDHARIIRGMVRGDDGEWLEPKPQAVICDHDAEGRATLRKHLGLRTTAAKKEVLNGLEVVAKRLRKDGTGKPRLMVFRDALVTRDQELDEAKLPIGVMEEIEGYIWSPTPDGRPNKDEPLKMNDHSVDAMRYMAAHVDLRPSPRIRSF
jgi:phage terminase large subunit